MKTATFSAAIALAVSAISAPAAAEGFDVVQTREEFISLINGKELSRVGIRLEVTETGNIEGRAFGTPVSGAWNWNDGYFCRDLFWGDRDLGANCQQVASSGSTIRFTSDFGSGDYADLRLR